MRYVFLKPLVVVLAAFMTPGCSDVDRSVETQAVAETEMVADTVPTRRCYRNEYPFKGEPDQKDIESLDIEIDGDRAIGVYNWLPAFKDKRVGRFEGSFYGRSVTASYEFTQEGQAGVAMISIRLEPAHVVVEGDSPELGLNATIARIDC